MSDKRVKRLQARARNHLMTVQYLEHQLLSMKEMFNETFRELEDLKEKHEHNGMSERLREAVDEACTCEGVGHWNVLKRVWVKCPACQVLAAMEVEV